MPTITLSLTTSGAWVIEYFSVAFSPTVDGVSQTMLAGLRVDRDQVRVDRAHEQRVAENREAAVDAAAARPRLERRACIRGPERPAGAASSATTSYAGGLHRVQHAVDDQRRRLEFLERLRLPHPLQLEVLTLAGVIWVSGL